MKTTYHRIFRSTFWFAVALMSMIPSDLFAQNHPNAKQLGDYFKDLPFPMQELKEPEFPDRSFSIVDFGAVADGRTLNTKIFAATIAACAKAGGGTVIVPPGIWRTGPIELKSNVNLYVQKGALVLFSKNLSDYPFIPGLDGKSGRFIIEPPIHAYRANNIAITGPGIFDGGGEAWRYVKKIDMTELQWKTLVASGGVVTQDGEQWWPSREALEGQKTIEEMERSGKPLTATDYAKTREYLRPNLVSFMECNEVLLDGPTFSNSPKHEVMPQKCENVIIRNVTVLAPEYGQNTDGINLGSCRNVIVYNCTVDVGDDGICLKPGAIGELQKPGPSCENILVEDCVVYRAHGGFVIGSESVGGVRNILVRNCVYSGTDVGLRFKSARGRGGVVEKVYFDNIQMRSIRTDAILFDMYYSGGAPEAEAVKDLTIRRAEPVTALTPQFRDFFVKNIVCVGADRAVVINGLPEMTIKNMVLDNVSVTSKRGVFIADADGAEFNNCRIDPQSGPVFTVIQSRNVTVKGGHYPAAADVFVKVTGEKSDNIRFVGVDMKRAKKSIELGNGVKKDAVQVE